MYICTYVHRYSFKPIGQQCAVNVQTMCSPVPLQPYECKHNRMPQAPRHLELLYIHAGGMYMQQANSSVLAHCNHLYECQGNQMAVAAHRDTCLYIFTHLSSHLYTPVFTCLHTCLYILRHVSM